jgi:predicted amidohydrolase
MRIALYQCPPLPLDIDGNLQRLAQQARIAAQQGADLLVCPEMYLSGYNIGAAAAQELAQLNYGPAASRIAAMAQANGIAILYGYPERHDGRVYNAVQLIDAKGNTLANYRKTHLYGDLDRAMFSPGETALPIFELNGWRLGLLICYDVEFPENTRDLALAGADVILVPTANMEPYDFVADVTVRARAYENQCYVAYANYCGSEGQINYCGLSSLCAPDGSRIALAGRDELLILGTLDRQLLDDSRTLNPYFKDRRAELYTRLSND